jgi:hypothetical protein
VVTYSPRYLTFDVEVVEDGWLLVTERWARSWRVKVNGIAQRNHGGNFIFRAVPVTAGRNHVVFTYEPLAFPWFPLASWGLLALVGSIRTVRVFRNTSSIP